ncbi:MAG: hypothetical protein GY795_28990 [Desulfobacterales bacterium]|nr:hypothetical protein [Desulfobacterales bacterium]
MMSQADTVREDMEPLEIRMWLFAHDGLTKQAEAFAKKLGYGSLHGRSLMGFWCT